MATGLEFGQVYAILGVYNGLEIAILEVMRGLSLKVIAISLFCLMGSSPIVSQAARDQTCKVGKKYQKKYQVKCKGAKTFDEIGIVAEGNQQGEGTVLSFITYMNWFHLYADEIANRDNMKFNQMVNLGNALTQSLRYKLELDPMPGKKAKKKTASKEKDYECPDEDAKKKGKTPKPPTTANSLDSLVEAVKCFFPDTRSNAKDAPKFDKKKFLENIAKLPELLKVINQKICEKSKDKATAKVGNKVKTEKESGLRSNGEEHTCDLTKGKLNIASREAMEGCATVDFFPIGDNKRSIQDLCKSQSGFRQANTGDRQQVAPFKPGTAKKKATR